MGFGPRGACLSSYLIVLQRRQLCIFPFPSRSGFALPRTGKFNACTCRQALVPHLASHPLSRVDIQTSYVVLPPNPLSRPRAPPLASTVCLGCKSLLRSLAWGVRNALQATPVGTSPASSSSCLSTICSEPSVCFAVAQSVIQIPYGCTASDRRGPQDSMWRTHTPTDRHPYYRFGTSNYPYHSQGTIARYPPSVRARQQIKLVDVPR